MKEKVFCTFCQLPQKVYKNKHVHPLELIGLAGVGAITTYLIWQDFHWTGVFLFASLALLSETIHQTRWRQSVKCKGCGFDAILYKKNPQSAAEEVKAFLEMRKQDPRYLLKPQPRIKPIIKKVKDFKWKDTSL